MARSAVAGEVSAASRRARERAVARTHGSSIGLALGGGGPLGGIYEVGALIALADSLDGIDFNRLDAYVGVSVGSFVAAGLANGISPAQMYRVFIDDGADALPWSRRVLRPAFAEYYRRVRSLPRLSMRAARHFLRDPLHGGLLESVTTLSRAIPTGIFDNAAMDGFLARLLSGQGRSNDFRRLAAKLYLVATNLDSGALVVFGAPGHEHVPISTAITASAAAPGLFPPVEIDGQHYVDGALNKTLHASIALDQGVDLLLCVNPMVPYDASLTSRRSRPGVDKLKQGGLPLVLSQTIRAIIHSRMVTGMDGYSTGYPGQNVILFEPRREDAQMFFTNVLGFRQRKRTCALAYTKTRRNLLARTGELEPVLERHGIRLRRDRLEDSHRHVSDAVRDPRPIYHDPARERTVRDTARDLARALDELERFVAGADRARALP